MQSQQEIGRLIAALSPHLKAAARNGGQLPPERQLAELLGVPRRRLRYALDMLQQRGAVFRRHGQGTFVTPPPHPGSGRYRLLAGQLTLKELMDVRRQIEPRMAELAAAHIQSDDIAPLETMLEKTRRARNAGEYDLADEVFHYRIAELAKNALFLEIYDLVRRMRGEVGWRERRLETNVPDVIRNLGEQHQRIFDAIAAGQQDEAGMAVRDHLNYVAATIEAGDC